MPIAVLCAGRLKEKYWQDACAEYAKRISRYAKLEIVEVPDESDGPQALKKEGERLLARLQRDDFAVALCIEAKECSSTDLASFLRERAMAPSRTVFVIGGSNGLHPDVVSRADRKLSMSPMTFPHQLARVMLLEQIYRACKINAGEKYHK